jgi:hypothetical protein
MTALVAMQDIVLLLVTHVYAMITCTIGHLKDVPRITMAESLKMDCFAFPTLWTTTAHGWDFALPTV